MQIIPSTWKLRVRTQGILYLYHKEKRYISTSIFFQMELLHQTRDTYIVVQRKRFVVLELLLKMCFLYCK